MSEEDQVRQHLEGCLNCNEHKVNVICYYSDSKSWPNKWKIKHTVAYKPELISLVLYFFQRFIQQFLTLISKFKSANFTNVFSLCEI